MDRVNRMRDAWTLSQRRKGRRGRRDSFPDFIGVRMTVSFLCVLCSLAVFKLNG